MALESACCAEDRGPEPRFPEQTASHSCSPSLPIHPSTSHLTERVRAIDQQREEGGGGSWQRCQALLGSVEQLCLIKCLASEKERGGEFEYFTEENDSRGGRGGMNDGEILLKSLNDRGQFLLTRRKRYNESTDWWILRFKS